MRKLTRKIVAMMMAAGAYAFLASPLTPVADARLKDHPKLEAAAGALVQARAYIEHTPSDFRGHKVELLRVLHEAIHEVALAAGEHDRAVIDGAPIPLAHVHPQLWEAREKIKEGRIYLAESREGFFGHKVAAVKWIDETLRHLDAVLVE